MTADSPAVATTRALAASYRRRRCWHEADAIDGTLAEYDQLRAQRDAALDQQVAVLELHRRTKLTPGCVSCGMPWPCPTAAALGVTS